MNFELNRYFPEDLLNQLKGQKPEIDSQEWMYTFQSELSEFHIFTSSADAKEDIKLRAFLETVLAELDVLDNLVQKDCEKQEKISTASVSDYSVHIGYIELKENFVSINYYGSYVNTEWAAEFRLTQEGTWETINF